MLRNFFVDNKTLITCPLKKITETTTHFLTLLAQHDQCTAAHSYNVERIAVNFAMKLNLSYQIIQDISTAALLHDIGKIKIPKKILRKPAKLTETEFEIIKKHSEYGFEILKATDQLKDIAEAVLYHHEKINGEGYPMGKDGRNIPLVSRILSIADVYESITSDRVYRKAMTQKEALQVMYDGRGTHFDSILVSKFCIIIGEC